ncbi:MAG: hypothetical protein ABIE42_06565 [Candidatus Eisenbacteria bacterium]
MAVTFHPSREAIELALKSMKEAGLVHPDAAFNEDAPDGLRGEVTYRDPHFSYRLGRTSLESRIVDSALELLKREGHVPVSADYDRQAMEKHRAELKEEFEGPFDFVRLPEGAWVIAHDNLDWTAQKQMAPYLEFVRDEAHFSESICFDIDDCGMELSIK